MRKLFCILFVICSMACNAQWSSWNDFMQGQQKAYEAGARDAKLLHARMEIAGGDYANAYKKLKELANESYEAAFLLGTCYELGMGTSVNHDLAKRYYSKGGSAGRFALDRIKSRGYLESSDANRKAFSNGVSMLINGQAGGGYNSFGGSGSSSGSSSSSSTCRSCRGTGNCTMCHGRGGYEHNAGIYVGDTGRTWTTCPACNGSRKCQVCYGRGSIR